MAKTTSKSSIRHQPMTHIHAEEKGKIDDLASKWNLFKGIALRIVLIAGLRAIENNSVDIQRIKEELSV